MDMISSYITPWMNMDKQEHRQQFFSILEGCARGVSAGGHLDKRYDVTTLLYVILSAMFWFL